MDMRLTETQRAALERAASAATRTRVWKRCQAVLLLGEGQAPAVVAHSLRWSVSSVYAWAAVWRREGVAGLAEGVHPGRARRVDVAGQTRLESWLTSDPQQHGHRATGWTAAGYVVSERTVRRAVHRLGYRWKRPQYVLGRPDPAYEDKKGG